MADFDISYGLLSEKEGQWSNNPADRGGETYRGISRINHPLWPGWSRVDGLKGPDRTPRGLKLDVALQQMVEIFYFDKFWTPIHGDEIPDQRLANSLFLSVVNMGVGPAVGFLQLGLNILNRNQTLYPDIVIDGICGRKTAAIIIKFCSVEKPVFLLYAMTIEQGHHYNMLALRLSSQETFIRGWYDRLLVVVRS